MKKIILRQLQIDSIKRLKQLRIVMFNFFYYWKFI